MDQGYSSTHFVHVPYNFEAYEDAENETQYMVEELNNIQKDQKIRSAYISNEKRQTETELKVSPKKQQQLKELVQKREEIQKKKQKN